MSNNIKLPPLPKASKMHDIPGYDEEELKDYARTAIQADRARRALLAERDDLAKDAARYRWLRDPCSGAERVIFYCRGDYGRGLMSSAMLDAAIDKAMEKEVRND